MSKPAKTTVTEPTIITAINPANIAEAVNVGKSLISDGMTKAQAVRRMFPLIEDEPRELIWQAFQDGAGLTPKGAVTYLYNIRRDAKKSKVTAPVDD